MKNDFSAKSKIADAFNKKSPQKDVDKINLIAREVVCKILNSSFGARCRENYFRTVRAELFNILEKKFGNSAIKISDLEFATDFYAYALTGLIPSKKKSKTNAPNCKKNLPPFVKI